MLSCDQIMKQAMEILARDPDPMTADCLRNIIAKAAENQSMRMLDNGLHGYSFTEVTIPEDQKEAVKEEMMKPGACVEIYTPPDHHPMGGTFNVDEKIAKLSDDLLVATYEDEQNRQAWQKKQTEAENAIMPLPHKSVHTCIIEALRALQKDPGRTYFPGLNFGRVNYEAKGGKPADKPRLRPLEEIKQIADAVHAKRVAAAMPLHDAVSALHNSWRSDGRPHKYEVD